MPRYYEWDYENGIVTEFKREGFCRLCGACCRASTGIIASEAYRDEPLNGGHTTNDQGIWQELSGRWRRFYQLDYIRPDAKPCPALTKDGRCRDYSNRNRLCQVWPLSPRHIAPFPSCGYFFKELNHWQIDEIEEANG